jgi:hypothetical protein
MEPHNPLNTAKNEIRLLRLKPAKRKSEAIECELVIVSLDHRLPQYQALSYVWGSTRDTRNIKIQDHDFHVTTNLYKSLQRLRLDNDERIIWVDAICINQKDLNERADQVTRMGSIYGRAVGVIFWLGEAFEDCKLAFDCLKKMGEMKDLHFRKSLSPNIVVHDLDLYSTKLQDALICFFTLPWWTRVWTVQEYVLAQRAIFQCGQDLLYTSLARQASRNFFKHIHIGNSCCNGIQFAEASPGTRGEALLRGFVQLESLEFLKDSMSVLYATTHFRERKSADIRDKIYGMLGMATGEYAASVHPDYALPPAQIFESSAIAMMERTGRLDILSHIPNKLSDGLKLPSFVPDWTAPIANSRAWLPWLTWLVHVAVYNASSNRRAKVQKLGPGQILLKGIIFDNIVGTSSVSHSVTNSVLRQEIRDLVDFDQDLDLMYCNTQTTRKKTFWLTMCGGLKEYFDSSRGDRPSYRRVNDVNVPSFEAWDACRASDLSRFTGESYTLEVTFRVVATGRRFAMTERGYMGWCPENCAPGDLVTIFEGGPVPIVLRPAAGDDQYVVVGDAYIHGIMDGEAFEMTADSEPVVEDIVLV